MEENSVEKPPGRFWRAIIFTILFVLPFGSLFYLYSGRSFHRKAVAELEQIAKVSDFQLKNQENEVIHPEDFRGKVTIVNFLPTNLVEAKSLTDRIAKVHRSFDETDDVLFFSFIVADSSQTLLQTATKLGITDHKQWFLLGTAPEAWSHLAKDVYHLQNPVGGV
ncbi:MAG: hypothetical protein HY842_09135, partial [Bacteroidetes bacterium]|nr:hypothetical protein [Bacteroidota bacterium]